MDKNNGSNQEIKDKEPIKKDASTSIPQKTQDKELPKKDSSRKQDNKPIIEVRHTIIPPQNLDFVAIIDQPSAPPPFIYPVSQQLYRSATLEIPPSNLPRYLHFYKVLGQGNDFFLRIL